MPDVVRLPAHVPDGEIRLYWDVTTEATGLHVWGPRSDSRLVMGHIEGKRWELGGEFTERYDALRRKAVVEAPSLVDQLKERGYDPKTLVFSIRKTGEPVAEALVPDDIRRRLEDAQTALAKASKIIEATSDWKDVYVLDEREWNDLRDSVMEAEDGIAGCIDGLPQS